LYTAEFLSYAPSKDKEGVSRVLGNLEKLYCEPGRYYHTLDHVQNGLKVHHELCTTPLSPIEFFAWMYHDAVYDTTASDNEQKSALVFMRDASSLGVSVDDSDRVVQLILATDPSAVPLSIINDMDLAGLGAESKVYDLNTANIRKEYNWVEPDVWNKGRRAVLLQLLQRPELYITEPFISKFTLPAIDNMSRELFSLGNQ
jgi:predicted metal-dependent HD superfamily phosphohydrolase